MLKDFPPKRKRMSDDDVTYQKPAPLSKKGKQPAKQSLKQQPMKLVTRTEILG